MLFDIDMTFDIWHAMTFDIWHLTFDIWHLTFDMTEGTDSTSTDTIYDIGTMLSHYHWWILWLS